MQNRGEKQKVFPLFSEYGDATGKTQIQCQLLTKPAIQKLSTEVCKKKTSLWHPVYFECLDGAGVGSIPRDIKMYVEGCPNEDFVLEIVWPQQTDFITIPALDIFLLFG